MITLGKVYITPGSVLRAIPFCTAGKKKQSLDGVYSDNDGNESPAMIPLPFIGRSPDAIPLSFHF